jgi:hypothetical protein
MFHLNRWQSGTSLMVTLGFMTTAIAPLTLTNPATATPTPAYTLAQLFPSQPSNTVVIPAGAQIPVRYNAAQKIVIAPNETVPLTLTVAKNVRSSSGLLLIPAGSQVSGRLQPVSGGSQFIADNLVLTNGTRLRLDADSDVVSRTQEVQPGVNGDALIKGSVIGAGAATILSGVLGNRRITFRKIAAGAGAGALGGLLFGKKKNEVIVINPDNDLTLTLNSRLALNPSYY